MTNCPFCSFRDAVLGNDGAYARYDKHPVTPGHLLIVTRRHVADFFDASAAERSALFDLLIAGKALLEERFQPDGYNIGVNIGATAGQTIMHLHVHLIPRYRGDVADPRGGVRGVIPTRQRYPGGA